MNTAVINIKTRPETKIKAQLVAKDLGLNLSSIINAYLTQLIKTKTVAFSTREEPTEYLLEMLRHSREDRKRNKLSPSFDNAKDAIAWLKKQEK